MQRSSKASLLPSLEASAKQLGLQMRLARQSRGWTLVEMAARAVTSVSTCKRIESGDPSVALGSWLSVLSQLQLLDSVVAASAPEADKLGQAYRDLRRPQRVRPGGLIKEDRYDF